MKILYLAPLPPPITGHSLASKVLLDALSTNHQVDVIDLTVGSHHNGRVTVARSREVLKALARVLTRGREADAIYLTIAESPAGNLKDLMIYLLSVRRLDRMVIHLHGGTIGRLLFDRHPSIARINRFFIRRMGGVIILGPSHLSIFEGFIARDRIHIVPNFAEGTLLVDNAAVRAKFEEVGPLRLLFVSGMDKAKGAPDLVAAYKLLPVEIRKRFHVDIAGRFPSDGERAEFEEAVRGLEGIRYHGVVEGASKRELFARAHIFCLPTAMFEGQPISILEAYASGCAVLTTGQAGILDIFSDGENGYIVKPNDPRSIAETLIRALNDVATMEAIALANVELARKRYTANKFNTNIEKILENLPNL